MPQTLSTIGVQRIASMCQVICHQLTFFQHSCLGTSVGYSIPFAPPFACNESCFVEEHMSWTGKAWKLVDIQSWALVSHRRRPILSWYSDLDYRPKGLYRTCLQGRTLRRRAELYRRRFWIERWLEVFDAPARSDSLLRLGYHQLCRLLP